MSIWAEIKKSINNDLEIPLNVLIKNGVIGGYQLFTSSGEFTVPIGVTRILITAIGSGGGGGGAGSVYTYNVADSSGFYVNSSACGGGGGSGYYIKDRAKIVTPGTKIAITINAGGVGGTGAVGARNEIGGTGGTGGSVIVGNLLTVNGGNGGLGATYAERSSSSGDTSGTGGAGGTGGVVGSKGTNSDLKGSDGVLKNIAGGTGGIPLEVFGGAYGRGGQGGDATVTEVAKQWYAGKPGSVGNTGAVLICWGQFTHDTLY